MTHKDKKTLELFMLRADISAAELCRYAASSMLNTAVILQNSEDKAKQDAGQDLLSRYLAATPTEAPKPVYTTENTKLQTWFERDRANVELADERGKILLDVWDQEVFELLDDGYLNRQNLHGSAVEYVNQLKGN